MILKASENLYLYITEAISHPVFDAVTFSVVTDVGWFVCPDDDELVDDFKEFAPVIVDMEVLVNGTDSLFPVVFLSVNITIM